MEHQAKTTYYLNTLDPKYRNKIKWISGGDMSHASDEEKRELRQKSGVTYSH